MKPVIVCTNVSKSFGKTNALNAVNLEIQENKIYGLLGLNGAGKTTLLKIITKQLFPIDGSIEIFGVDPFQNRKNEEVLKNICFIKESTLYPGNFKTKDILNTAETLYSDWDREFAGELISNFGINTDKSFKALSKGEQSSVAIIMGLASRAPITIFDEAYLGLDASMRQLFYDTLIQDYSEHQRTIIFSTHLIDECSSMFEEIIIINNGKVMLNEDVYSMKEKSFYISGRKDKLELYLKNKKILHKEEIGRLAYNAIYSNITEDERQNMEKDDIEIQPMSLQKLFIYLTSKDRGENHG